MDTMDTATSTTTDEQLTRAATAYRAYGDSSSWKNYQGNPIPTWDDLPEAIRTHWVAATDAISVVGPPRTVEVVDVDVAMGTEYPDELWSRVVQSIKSADDEVDRARAVKQAADAAFAAALQQRRDVQVPRDYMIATSNLNSAEVSRRLDGTNRARCSAIRIKIRGAGDPVKAFRREMAEIRGTEVEG